MIATLEEITKFAKDANAIDPSRITKQGILLFCDTTSVLKLTRINLNGLNEIKVSSPSQTPGLSNTDILRPVIDITY